MFNKKLVFFVFLALSFQNGLGMCRRRTNVRDINPGDTDDRNPIIVSVESLPRYRTRYADGQALIKKDHFLEGFMAGVTSVTCVFIIWYNFLNEPLD